MSMFPAASNKLKVAHIIRKSNISRSLRIKQGTSYDMKIGVFHLFILPSSGLALSLAASSHSCIMFAILPGVMVIKQSRGGERTIFSFVPFFSFSFRIRNVPQWRFLYILLTRLSHKPLPQPITGRENMITLD